MSPHEDMPLLFSSTNAWQWSRKSFIIFTPSRPFRLLYLFSLSECCLVCTSAMKWHYPTLLGQFMFCVSGPLCLNSPYWSQSWPYDVHKSKEYISMLKPEKRLFYTKLICFAENTQYFIIKLSKIHPQMGAYYFVHHLLAKCCAHSTFYTISV